jgi:2-polyprenyl-3-methyl-5-hydroxy-6-metoxy-1,4-benzoquinol methylase
MQKRMHGGSNRYRMRRADEADGDRIDDHAAASGDHPVEIFASPRGARDIDEGAELRHFGPTPREIEEQAWPFGACCRHQPAQPLFANLAGKSCLDVGCSSGFFSLKAKELGSTRVLGVDSGEQVGAIDQARFASRVLDLPVTFETISAYDLSRFEERFDVVLFLGVFYHLRHPLVALEAIRSVCTGSLIFQTITTPNRMKLRELDPQSTVNVGLNSKVMQDDRFPSLRFVEGQIAGDSSCWFVPNVQAVAAMLRTCGFEPEEFIFPDEQEVIVRCRVR